MHSTKVKVDAQIVPKQSKDLKPIEHKAKANLTEEEILQRNTIGKFTDTRASDESTKED